jgi:CopG family nickel-responsive transcriptional regulator
MERITMSLKPALARQFDEFIRGKGYSNRSEAMRDLIRERLEGERLQENEDSHCVATLSYVYNHHEMALASRLTSSQHAHHDLTISTMHIHLDHENCLETVVLRGNVRQVRSFAESIIAERGVRHGTLNMVPVSLDPDSNGHVHHIHSHPQT